MCQDLSRGDGKGPRLGAFGVKGVLFSVCLRTAETGRIAAFENVIYDIDGVADID